MYRWNDSSKRSIVAMLSESLWTRLKLSIKFAHFTWPAASGNIHTSGVIIIISFYCSWMFVVDRTMKIGDRFSLLTLISTVNSNICRSFRNIWQGSFGNYFIA